MSREARELIGSNHPVWNRYKERFRLSFLDVTDSENEAPIVLGGRRLSAKESEQLWEDMGTALSRLDAEAAKIGDPFAPWETANAAELDRRSFRAWIDALDTTPLCRAGIEAQMAADNGVRTAWQSYLGNLAMIKGHGLEKFWTDTEVFRCRGGNQQLATTLAAAVGMDRIKTRTTVTAIDLRDSGARGHDGGWKDARRGPRHSRGAAAGVEPDRNLADAAAGARAADGEQREVPDGAQQSQRLESHGRFAHGRACERDLGRRRRARRLAGAAMVAFSGAASADECRGWTATERNERYLAALQRVYPGIRASFIKARFMDWPSDPWVKASYSFPAPGQVTTMGPLMQQPIGGRLHLAGEHTCYAFVGYMEGALQSGVRVAQRIVKA